MNVVDHVWTTMPEKRVAVFCLEMTRKQLVMRLVSSRSGIPIKGLEQGQTPRMMMRNLQEAVVGIKKINDSIYDKARPKLSEIRSKCRVLKNSTGLDLVVIDYLQLIRPDERKRSREEEVAEISASLKEIAKDLEVPIIILAQLNREVEGRKSGQPKLSDLRESGAIEQDADLVAMLWRDEEQSSDSQAIVNMSIVKNRNGEEGLIKLKSDLSILKFSQMELA